MDISSKDSCTAIGYEGVALKSQTATGLSVLGMVQRT